MNKRMTRLVRRFFSEDDKSFQIIVEKNTHKNLSCLKHEFIQLADFDKVGPLKNLVKEYRKYARKHKTSAIVFCNSVQCARAVEHALAEEGMTSSPKSKA